MSGPGSCSPNPGDFRLATWNCSPGRYREKREAILRLEPNITVLQEASRPADDEFPDLWWGSNPKKGLAVVAGPQVQIEPGPLEEGAPWSIVPVRLLLGQSVVHILAVWTRREFEYLRGLKDALDMYGPFLSEAPSVVLGDFNSNAIWDSPGKSVDFSNVAAYLEERYGLSSAYHTYHNESYGAETRPTYYHQWDDKQPFHIDYCFVPRTWSIGEVHVGKGKPWASLSDHRPITVDVSLD